MELNRTVSAESTSTSTSTWAPTLLQSSAAVSRKGRASEETSDASAVRASISMPPPASKAVPRQFPSRRPSKASDTSLLETLTEPQASSAIDDSDSLTPTLESTRTLTDRRPESEARLSFSSASLYSIGSGIYPSAHRMSGPASNSGSDEGTWAYMLKKLTIEEPSSAYYAWPMCVCVC